MTTVIPFLEFDDLDRAVKAIHENNGAAWNELLRMNENVTIRQNVEPKLRQWFFKNDAE